MKKPKTQNKTNQDNVWQISNDRLLKRKEQKKKTVSIYICRSFICLSGYIIQIDIDKSMVFYLEKHTHEC